MKNRDLSLSSYLEASVDRVETTLGDLIEALTQVAVESGSSTDESYELAAAAVTEILYRNKQMIDLSIM